ncbi:unnamed protein product [Aspergillus oryzae var. brunneus]|uniref:Unnamed protein product n=1 Tax=Aspergillus oryzae var. brunneus TaxID=332754 RepID=A0ABQ6LEH9_ASPOZ|nr:unnamed protein product [Aspergillus oryzae]GMG54660.1 unnamed protein product [Aspergillus oryzae var. brunneus]
MTSRTLTTLDRAGEVTSTLTRSPMIKAWCGTTMSTIFLKEDGPFSANPSLWRQSQLTRKNGLYHVAGPIYQVRGLDLSNTTIIEGDEGIIVIDPLTSLETGAAALALYQKHRGSNRDVKAIIYTHSHVDHFGGVKGFVSEKDVEEKDV